MKQVKKYDENYKNQLCEMMIVGGKSPTEVHKIMGVSVPTLTKWRQRYLLAMGTIQSEGKLKSAIEVDADMRALRKELAQVKWERDVLKKAASIFANEPRTNMR